VNPLAERTRFSQVIVRFHFAVRAAQGRLSALRVFRRKSILYGAFVWERKALNGPFRCFPARAGRRRRRADPGGANVPAPPPLAHPRRRGRWRRWRGGCGQLGRRRPGCWLWGSVALSLCTTAHPFHTRIANIFGASISEATMRPNPSRRPRDRGRRRLGRRLRPGAGAGAAALPTVRADGGGQAPSAFSYVNRFCMGLLYGRAGRLNTKNGGFRPGQCLRAGQRGARQLRCPRPPGAVKRL
jgi:hypothetical protein